MTRGGILILVLLTATHLASVVAHARGVISGIHHLGVATQNVAESLAFYTKVLGGAQIDEPFESNYRTDSKTFKIRFNDFVVELIEFHSEGSSNAYSIDNNSPTTLTLGFWIDSKTDVENFANALRSANLSNVVINSKYSDASVRVTGPSGEEIEFFKTDKAGPNRGSIGTDANSRGSLSFEVAEKTEEETKREERQKNVAIVASTCCVAVAIGITFNILVCVFPDRHKKTKKR